ncbi:uncharacterized protein LOC132759231 isoform X2 [Ruditapes philippinarum]|nr:uncharacterized protein LOC132759231 isoform X2 [Ruditapes philippinarum]XP_060606947.1 uncharacterized protein LOC132759231 isoform X2 [Ruditapes philippinarum]XP_060606948.1 uncharacterized protein LOC132759231 isoform X2 [Ruditapes philippinarum]
MFTVMLRQLISRVKRAPFVATVCICFVLMVVYPFMAGESPADYTMFKHGRVIKIDRDAFEPEVIEDIKTVDSKYPRIPRIIHFVYITGGKESKGVPSKYEKNIKSFLHFHPNWTYYFWSDQTARALILERHPDLISLYDSYSRPIVKADALRYVLMYEFGGVYADLDLECLRPLDRATMKYACILSPEPFVHSAVWYGQNYFLTNAFLLCRKKHPFYLQLIKELPNYAHFSGSLQSAGTVFFTNIFEKFSKIPSHGDVIFEYNSNDDTPYFYQVKLESAENENATYIVNSQYFMGSLDTGTLAYLKFTTMCALYSFWNDLVRRGCKLWKKQKAVSVKNPYAYIDHAWLHSASKWFIKTEKKMVSIESIIPQVKQYKSVR